MNLLLFLQLLLLLLILLVNVGLCLYTCAGMRCVAMISWLHNIVVYHEEWIFIENANTEKFFGMFFSHVTCVHAADVHGFHPLHKNNIFKSFTAIISDVSKIHTFFSLCRRIVPSPFLSSVQFSNVTVRRNFCHYAHRIKNEYKYFIWCFQFSTRLFIQCFWLNDRMWWKNGCGVHKSVANCCSCQLDVTHAKAKAKWNHKILLSVEIY